MEKCKKKVSFRTMLARKKETCEKFLRASEKNLVSIEQMSDRRNGALVATEEKYGMFLSLRLATMTANTVKLHFLRIKHTFTSTSTSHKIKKFTKF